MQSAVSQVAVGEEVQLVFCHVNFYIREESGKEEEGDDKKGMGGLFCFFYWKIYSCSLHRAHMYISLLVSVMLLQGLCVDVIVHTLK